MFLPSINAFNCGDILKGSITIPSGNEMAIRKNIEPGTICSQVSRKLDDGSSTKRSSLYPYGMAKLSRMGRFFLLALILIWATAFLPGMVEARMVTEALDKGNVFRSIVGLDAVNMVGDFMPIESSSKFFFKNETMDPNIPLTIGEGMTGARDLNISVMGCDKSRMVSVYEFDIVLGGELCNVGNPAIKYLRGYLKGYSDIRQFSNNIDWESSLVSLDPILFHKAQYGDLGGAILLRNLNGRFEYGIIHPQFFLRNMELYHGYIVAPHYFISQEEKTRYSQDLVEISRSKDKEPYDNIMEIKEFGSRITIDTVPTITVRKYTKGEKLGNWQNVDSGSVDMYINRSTIFEFSMNKIDMKQFLRKDKMNECAKDAAEQQAIFIDTEALSELYAYADSSNVGAAAGYRSGFYNIGATGAPIGLNESNILRYILMCQAVLDERSLPSDNRWMVLPTWATFLLNNSDIKDVSLTGESTSSLVNGHRIGRIGNFLIYQSNLYTAITDGTTSEICYPILFGHKSAISFASQLNDVEYFPQLENDLGKAMRGFQLYDWKVTKEESLGYMYAKMG